jgi:hypothetical protein
MTTFAAPWGRSLKLSTGIFVAVLSVPLVYQLSYGRPVGVLLLAVLGVALLFVVRGYEITDTHLDVRRLAWSTRLPLDGLQSAAFEPNATSGSLRTFGNGGLFSISGRFRNRRLGPYRAFVTDTERTVVLRFESDIVVVSPDDPERFVRRISQAAHL